VPQEVSETSATRAVNAVSHRTRLMLALTHSARAGAEGKGSGVGREGGCVAAEPPGWGARAFVAAREFTARDHDEPAYMKGLSA
jgi:hypothetical protein